MDSTVEAISRGRLPRTSLRAAIPEVLRVVSAITVLNPIVTVDERLIRSKQIIRSYYANSIKKMSLLNRFIHWNSNSRWSSRT
jgi:hypothetical protein